MTEYLVKKLNTTLGLIALALAGWVLLGAVVLKPVSAGSAVLALFVLPLVTTVTGIAILRRSLRRLSHADLLSNNLRELTRATDGLSYGLLGFVLLALFGPSIPLLMDEQSWLETTISLFIVTLGSGLILAGYVSFLKKVYVINQKGLQQ